MLINGSALRYSQHNGAMSRILTAASFIPDMKKKKKKDKKKQREDEKAGWMRVG